MQRSECKIGMAVVFGRKDGDQTTGTVVKMNRVAAKVKVNKPRGNTSIGTVWGVPYDMMLEFVGDPIKTDMPANTESLIIYSPFSDVENNILKAILGVYSELSPENLSCDGELPQHLIIGKSVKLKTRLRHLQLAYGMEVTESQIYTWYESKTVYDELHKSEKSKVCAWYGRKTVPDELHKPETV